MKKIIILFIILSAYLSACKESSNQQFLIKGTVKGMPKITIYLEEMGLNNELKMVDSTKSEGDGSFELQAPRNKNHVLYRLRMAEKSLLIINDVPNVKIMGEWQSMPKLSQTVSPGTSSLNTLLDRIYKQEENIASSELALDSLNKQNISDSLLLDFQRKVTEQNNSFIVYLKKYADTTKFLPVAIVAALRTSDQEYINAFTSRLSNRFGNQDMVAQYASFLKSNAPQIDSAKTIVAGMTAPDFTLTTPEGRKVTLTSFRGKYVLIDFWASWCAPCRKDNPALVAAYKNFRERNFEIIGVSLDDNKEKWLQAIASDRLTWPQVSDYQGWNSAVVDIYGVAALPANFLLDPYGKVIATNLRGEALVEKLQEVLK